jgi:hypothetical protein
VRQLPPGFKHFASHRKSEIFKDLRLLFFLGKWWHTTTILYPALYPFAWELIRQMIDFQPDFILGFIA